ncbi:MAG: beta-galactosidase, partial [Bacteroidales bacterium]|nr:beta-galactosidase [Bacteroidales bacterium]
MRKIITLKFFVIAICFVQISCTKQVEPMLMDLSGDDWVLWLDKTAEFKDDNLYLTGTSLSEIPKNKPTGGWEILSQNVVPWQSIQKKEYNDDENIPPIFVSVPGTVEEYLWNPNKGDYKGVSWWVKKVIIPVDKEGKKVKIHFRQGARMRCEVYVNQKLMHYNLVSGLPFEADITSALKFGEENEIAVRITDPEGNFGWADIRPHKWGSKPIPPSHGFGGILGKVELEFHNSIRINNLFVMNTPTIFDIETTLEVENA